MCEIKYQLIGLIIGILIVTIPSLIIYYIKEHRNNKLFWREVDKMIKRKNEEWNKNLIKAIKESLPDIIDKFNNK